MGVRRGRVISFPHHSSDQTHLTAQCAPLVYVQLFIWPRSRSRPTELGWALGSWRDYGTSRHRDPCVIRCCLWAQLWLLTRVRVRLISEAGQRKRRLWGAENVTCWPSEALSVLVPSSALHGWPPTSAAFEQSPVGWLFPSHKSSMCATEMKTLAGYFGEGGGGGAKEKRAFIDGLFADVTYSRPTPACLAKGCTKLPKFDDCNASQCVQPRA